MEARAQEELPVTLLELLSNALVLDATLPYLPLTVILRLSAVSRSFKRLVHETPRVFRYLDLSRCRGAYSATSVLPVDCGGQISRAEVRDENLTADEFYGGPLRGICTKLSKMGVMRDVQTLVLDAVGSVTHDVLSDILLSEQCCVQLLSVIGCPNLNSGKFQGLLHYLCRASRPEGTPRLKGVYIFGTKDGIAKQQSQSDNDSSSFSRRGNGITAIPGAQLGGPSTTSTTLLPGKICPPNPNPWFSRTGPVLASLTVDHDTWKTTLHACVGIIAFDAVLCSHTHAEMAPYHSDAMNAYLNKTAAATTPPVATYALGSNGCAGCGRAPKGAPVWGISDPTAFPLVSPPPFSGRLVDAVRPPPTTASSAGEGGQEEEQRLVVGCMWCLSGRHCQSCHRYWCGRCYDPQARKRALQPESLDGNDGAGAVAVAVSEELRTSEEDEGGDAGAGGRGTSIKVYNDLCTQFCAFSEDLAAGNGAMWG